jgi:DNA invertase Pin-like site-specific DNA recombinase
MAHIGYKRVSTQQQVTDRQLVDVHLDFIYEDKASGATASREQFQKMFEFVRKGDTVHVHSLDRFARSLVDLRKHIQLLIDKEVSIFFHKENLLFDAERKDNPNQILLLNVIGAVSEFELAMIRARQQEGIALAKERGVYKGKKRYLNEEQEKELIQQVAEGIPKSRIAKNFNLARETVYSYIHRNGPHESQKIDA